MNKRGTSINSSRKFYSEVTNNNISTKTIYIVKCEEVRIMPELEYSRTSNRTSINLIVCDTFEQAHEFVNKVNSNIIEYYKNTNYNQKTQIENTAINEKIYGANKIVYTIISQFTHENPKGESLDKYILMVEETKLFIA